MVACIICFISGLFAGVFVTSLCVAAKDNEREE